MPNKIRTQAFRLRIVCSLFSLLLLAMPLRAIPAGKVSSEYRLKAALLYKLTRFVEWPATSGARPTSFNICLLGRDDFGGSLDDLSERQVNNAPITIYRFTHSTGIDKPCQLLYISDSKQAFMTSIIHSLGTQPVLTISDAPRFAENGGMIQFVALKKRIGFKINLDKAQAAGLRIAAPLLELSTVISTPSHQDRP
ncbi:YfiR family protein [Thiolapillus sp.]